MRVFQKYALQFDGDLGQQIIFDGNDSPLEIKDDFSVILWLKRDENNPNGWNSIVFTRGSFEHDGFYIWHTTDRHYFQFHMLGNTKSIDLGVSYDEVINWNMISVTYKDGVVKAYCCDELRRELELWKGHYHMKNRNIVLGNYLSDNYYWYGMIGEVRIYDRALTDEEIQYLYNGGHIEDGLMFWLYPDDESVTLDSDGQTVLSVKEKINGYVGTAYNGVKLVIGKDVDYPSIYHKTLYVRKV